uniref:Protein kinase n=2 Tax=Kalmanozyma brasiliensis (strain GHG001) TaxID=1365824 RepID=V5ET33_KALBG
MFVAASPIKTRSRAARLTAGLPVRRTRGLGATDTAALDPMATPRLGNRQTQRTKKSVKVNAASPSKGHAQDEDEWMEDHSSDSDAVAAALQAESVSMAQARDRAGSRKTLRTRRSTAGSDTSLTSHQPRSRSASLEAPSDDAHTTLQDDDDADMATDDDGPTPTKFRKLRNGKMRLVAASSNGDGEPCEIRPSLMDDIDMDSASELTDIASSRASDDNGRDRRSKSPESDAAASESIEDAMTQPSFSSLSRLRKSQLEQLCHLRNIDMDEDDKKANLIKKLLDWHQLTQPEGIDPVAEPEQGDDAGDMQSDTSGVTAIAEDDEEQTRQRTPTRRRVTRAASNTHPDITDSDQPLLLRARGKLVSSEKLPTPPLTLRNEEAQPPQVGDGVDELNGLDLESLNLTDKEIAPSKLEKLEKIGSGGFKDVYVGKYRISKTRVNKVAIADIRDQLTEMDIKELSLLRDLRHENIVRFIGVSIPEDPRHVPCMIVSELCSNGDLFDYIRNTTAPSDAEVFRILLETARGLEYLHTRTPAIIHRDCKSTNVLITRRKTAKINDFGLARVKNTSRSMMRSLVGTVNWQAVELWTPKPHYNEKVDVWSAAMTFWEALQWHQPEKKYPFQGMNEHQIYQDVGQKRQRPYTGFIRRQFGGEIVDLLDRMWDHTPKNRPTMTEVCTELESLIQMKKETAAAGSSTRSGKA